MGKREIAPFPTVFSIRLENFLSFSSDLKLSSASSFNLEESKFVVWERVTAQFPLAAFGALPYVIDLHQNILKYLAKEGAINPLPYMPSILCIFVWKKVLRQGPSVLKPSSCECR